MKVGVLQFFSWPERRVDLATVYARALQRIEIMDRTGYDAVWLAEHHFSSFSLCPSVHMVGMPPRGRSVCASALQYRSLRFTIRCASPKRWLSSMYCPAVE